MRTLFSSLILFPVGALAAAALVGVFSGLAARTLYIIGLYEVAAGLLLGVLVVAWAHLWGVRDRRLYWGVAALCGVVWLGAHRGVEAWLFRLEQGRQIAEHGLLLAEEAVLHDSEDPLSLIDASLLAETGSAGVLGAAKLILAHGVTVQRVMGVDRIVRSPLWVHALIYALQALAVTFFLGRALGAMAAEPLCEVCGLALRRRRLGYLTVAQAELLLAAWSEGRRLAPQGCRSKAGRDYVLLALEDRCPLGHEREVGWELRRRRLFRLGSSSPGRVGGLPPLWRAADEGDVEGS